MWNRDKMWKCNENCIYGEIPMRGRDKYSTSLNIQKPALNPWFWEEKLKVPINYLSWQEQIGWDVIIY